MAEFKINNWGYYEIDFYNYGTEEEKKYLTNIDKFIISIYCKRGENWIKRSSGMTFNIFSMSYYPKLKQYLDYRLNIHLRKEKLLKISQC